MLFCFRAGQMFFGLYGFNFKAMIPTFHRRIVVAVAFLPCYGSAEVHRKAFVGSTACDLSGAVYFGRTDWTPSSFLILTSHPGIRKILCRRVSVKSDKE
jgi:hypothetical protein